MRHFSLFLFFSRIASVTPSFSLSFSYSLLPYLSLSRVGFVPAVLFLLSGVCVPQRLTQAPLTLLSLAVISPSVPNWLSAWRLSVGTEKHPSAREGKNGKETRWRKRSEEKMMPLCTCHSCELRPFWKSGRMDGFLFPSFLVVVDVIESFHVQEWWASTGVWCCFWPIFLLTGLNLRIEHSVHEFQFYLNFATPYMIQNKF